MDRYPFASPSSAGLLVGVIWAGMGALCAPLAFAAQEPPSAAPPVLPAEAATARPAAAEPAEAAAPAAASQPHKVLLLPPAFTEFQNAVSGLEAIPDWTEAARKNLADAAGATLLRAPGALQLEALPDLTPQETALLRDYIAVAQLIVSAGVNMQSGTWRLQRAEFDRSFGDGLRFLHERTGADYALLIDGMQIKQTGGRMAMKWLGTLAVAALGVIVVPTGGGGEVVSVCLLDLTNGTVAWFNSSQAIDLFTSSGADMRNATATQAAMDKLFASYPNIPALTD